MRNKKKSQISVLLLILLGLSIGFAALATTLKINGSATITKNTWNIYWDNIANQDGVTPTTSEIVSEDANHPNNIVTFEVTFDKPGDYYEFTVDAVNAGTLDAEILSIEKKYNDTVIPEEEDPNNRVVPAYLKYEVTYEDGSAINVGDKLVKANGNTPTTRTVKVRVEYDRNAVTNSDINNQSGTVSHSFSFSVQYGQATSSEDTDDGLSPDEMAARIAEIEANPENFRNPNQSVDNLDIAIDKDGNIVNLDDWSILPDPDDEYGYILKSYSSDSEGATLGNCYGYVTPATASDRIVNGELTTVFPSFVLVEGEDNFVPVTSTACLFARASSDSQERTPITKYPNLPKTINRLGAGTFDRVETFENIVIPKQIKYIEDAAFANAFNPQGTNNTLSFEEGSEIEEIGSWAFYFNYLRHINLPQTMTIIGYSAFRYNDLSGDLSLPQALTYIDQYAFAENQLTSVTFPSTAEYVTNCVDERDGQEYSCNSFDSGVTINHY